MTAADSRYGNRLMREWRLVALCVTCVFVAHKGRLPRFVLQPLLASRFLPASHSSPGGRARPTLLGINAASD